MRALREESVVALDLCRHESDEFAHGIEHLRAEDSVHFCLVVDVGNDLTYAVRHFCLSVAAVQQPEFVFACCQLLRDSAADGSRSTDKQDFHKLFFLGVDIFVRDKYSNKKRDMKQNTRKNIVFPYFCHAIRFPRKWAAHHAL